MFSALLFYTLLYTLLCSTVLYFTILYSTLFFFIFLYFPLNKPAAQAAGAEPCQCSSTSRQNSPDQKNRYNFWTNTAILMPFKI